MTRPLCRFLVVCLFALSLTNDRPATAATRVELVLNELRAERSVPWPITTGVPFAQGSLTDAAQCRLVDDQGGEQPLQTKVAATWDAAKTSIRWLTIDFIAQPGRKYALEFGRDVQRASFPAAITVDAAGTTLRAGPLQAVFAATGPAALQSVQIDLNGNGAFDADEQIATGGREGDHVYLQPNKSRFESTRDGAERTIQVETLGPVRACVRVDGWYTGPNGERIIAYRTRYHFFAGLPLVKLIDEFKILGSTRDVQFADIALPLELNLSGDARSVTAGVGDDANAAQTVSLRTPDDSVSLIQETYRHYGNLECRASLRQEQSGEAKELQGGERAQPWMQVADGRAAVTGSLRRFWQQFPKEWSATGKSLTLHLWSPHVAPLDFGEAGLRDFFGPQGEKYLLGWKASAGSTPITDFFYYAGRHALARDGADGRGINKHHEVWYHFGRAAEAAAGREYGDLADRQPLCLATGAWNVGTGVFGPLAARPNDSPYEAIVDRIFELERYAQDAFGDYGWWLFGAGPHYSYQWDKEAQRHYADPRRFEYHTYQRETQLWWNYLRSGERKFYDWSFPSENHWVDVAVSHVPLKFSTTWRGGTPGEASLHYAAGDWSIDSPLHYVRHHDTGEAWLRSAPQFWASYHRTLETTTLAYYLTGDERYNDVVNLWRDYWGALAGVRSDSADVPAHHREQLWWHMPKSSEATKTWAEMIRDYAPFQSGSRHQMTLFFNLSTLYEHTWDPKIGQAAREFADAYLRPEAPNGTWQCQDHHLPANADSPMLAHYWSSALWKYARATNDPRMPGVLQKYFRACAEADPYAGDVGIYSNQQIAWGWYFTKDPRHLTAAQAELDALLPHAEPLDKPEDLNRRIYNPYAPIKTLAAVPRLIAVLADAKKSGMAQPPTPPLDVQRTWIALRREGGKPTSGVLWGWDKSPAIVAADDRTIGKLTETAEHRSHRQPFDRALPGYRVYRNAFVVDDAKGDDWIFVRPKLETGIVELNAAIRPIWCWGGEAIRIEPRQTWFWRRSADAPATLSLESAQLATIIVRHNDQILTPKIIKTIATYSLEGIPTDAILAITTTGERAVWFRFHDLAPAAAWVAATSPGDNASPPAPPEKLSPVHPRDSADLTQTFVEGRFGQGLLIVPTRELQIPDQLVAADGTVRRLSDQRQGTIEFWIRRLWDERLAPVSLQPIMSAGSLFAPFPGTLPLGEWAHVAVVWHPIPGDETGRSLVHLYVDGVDYGNYRSIYWKGYAQPPTFGGDREWLKQFTIRGLPGMPFVIDDVRISTTPRYLNTKLDFGRSQTFNPDRFDVPQTAAEFDPSSVLVLPLDGDLQGTTLDRAPIAAMLKLEKR